MNIPKDPEQWAENFSAGISNIADQAINQTKELADALEVAGQEVCPHCLLAKSLERSTTMLLSSLHDLGGDRYPEVAAQLLADAINFSHLTSQTFEALFEQQQIFLPDDLQAKPSILHPKIMTNIKTSRPIAGEALAKIASSYSSDEFSDQDLIDAATDLFNFTPTARPGVRTQDQVVHILHFHLALSDVFLERYGERLKEIDHDLYNNLNDAYGPL
jgi:hypothetical protein